MRTIPASWKTGASRDTWLNSITKNAVLMIKITTATEVIRIASSAVTITGDGNYSALYFKDFQEIDLDADFLQNNAGAVGKMGQAELTLSNGVAEASGMDQQKFSDVYDVDSLINADVDVYFAPYEASVNGVFASVDEVMQVYKGVITNYSWLTSEIKIRINEYSNTRHKIIPCTVQEFSDKFGLGLSVPETEANSPVPITWGEGYWKIRQVADWVATADREIWFVIAHPMRQYAPWESYPHADRLLYWDPATKNFAVLPKYVSIPPPQRSVWEDAPWDPAMQSKKTARLKILELLDIPQDIGQWFILHPDEVHLGNDISGSNPEYMANQSLDSEDYRICQVNPNDAAHVMHNSLTYNVEKSCFRPLFHKKNFPEKTNFHVYGIWDLIYEGVGGSEAPKASWHFDPENIAGAWATKNVGTSYFIYDSLSTYMHFFLWHWTLLMRPWLIGMHPLETNGLTSWPFTYDGRQEHIDDDGLFVDIRLKRLDSGSYNRDYQIHEFGILILPKKAIDYYVYGNWNQRSMSEVIDCLFGPHLLNLDSGLIVKENFLTDYKIDAQVNERIDSYELISRICEEMGFLFYEDELGRERFIDLVPLDYIYEVTHNDILFEDNDLKAELTKAENPVYSEFRVEYKKHIVTGEYEANRYVTKDFENLDHVNPTELQALCQATWDQGVRKNMVVKLDFVRDDETAELILAKLVRFYSRKFNIVNFTTTLRLMDLEIGDQVRFNVDDYYETAYNYYVMRKRTNYLSNVTEFVLLETPWEQAGLNMTKIEETEIGEQVIAARSIVEEEDVHIGEVVVAALQNV
jgi:hypothetical protein